MRGGEGEERGEKLRKQGPRGNQVSVLPAAISLSLLPPLLSGSTNNV